MCRSSRALGVADYPRALYQLPLGLASFAVFKLMRMLVYRIGQAAYRRNPEAFHRWNILSGEELDKPHRLSRYMVVAPRWNPHAAVASAGPIAVEREVTIDLGDAVDEVGYWFFGALRFPSHASAGYVSTLNQRDQNGCLTLPLPRGDYYIVCRYYGWHETVSYPAISADGKEIVEPTEVSGKMNDFYPNLPKRDNVVYRASHYHIYVLLKYRSLFSERFIKKHLLPVGNEDTDYLYGTARKGETLTVTAGPTMLDGHRIFCTFYNTSSLPVLYTELGGPELVTEPLPCNGLYLIRVMQNSCTDEPMGTDDVAVSASLSSPERKPMPTSDPGHA